MTEKSTPQPWQAESLRLTAFRLPSAAAVDSRDWWKGVAGAEPENHVEAPRVNAKRDDGPFLGGTLTLGIDPARIDWVLAAGPNQETPLAALGPVAEVVEQFAKALNAWLKLAPPVQRLAVGVIASVGVPDRVSGYRAIQGLLQDVKLDVENISDFVYQINKPRQSKVFPTLKINRLSKWSVLSLRSIQLVLGGGSFGGASFSGPEQYAIRLELDINTAAEHQGELSTQDMLPELARLVLEITERGDIP